jgi:hypothetical protein
MITKEHLREALIDEIKEAYKLSVRFDNDSMSVHYHCGSINSLIGIGQKFEINFNRQEMDAIYLEAVGADDARKRAKKQRKLAKKKG